MFWDTKNRIDTAIVGGMCRDIDKARGSPGIKNVPIIYCRIWTYITHRDVKMVCLGKVKHGAELKSLSCQCSGIPCQWMQMQSMEPKPSPPMALLWLTVLHSTQQCRGIMPTHSTNSPRIQETSLIWMTFRSHKLCSNSLSFKIKGISLFPFIFNVDFYKGTSITEDHIFFHALSHATCLNLLRIPMLNAEFCKYTKINYKDFATLLSTNSFPQKGQSQRGGISFLSVSTHLESFSAGIRRDVWIRAVSKYKGYWMKTHTSVKGNNSL